MKTTVEFWKILDDANFEFAALERSLDELSEEALGTFYGLHWVLSWDACYEDHLEWDEADWPAEGGPNRSLSEDTMQEFAEWMVSQGSAYFEQIVEETISLQDALHAFNKPDKKWSHGQDRKYTSTHIPSLADEIFQARFGTSLIDNEEKLVDRARELRDN